MTERPTILFAEDDPFIHKLIGDCLRFGIGDGCGVIGTRNGQEAWDRLQEREQGPVDLVITDLRMPKMNGQALIEAMRANGHGETPVIVVSAHTDQLMEQLEAWGVPPDQVLSKPFDPIALIKLSRNLLGLGLV